MTADPTDAYSPIPALERTDPARRRAFIPDRPPPARPFGTSEALRDLAEADVRARERLPAPPPGFHWTPRIEPSPADLDLARRYGGIAAEESNGGISARLVYRLERDAR